MDYMAMSIPVAFTYPMLKELKAGSRKHRLLRLLLWGFPVFSWVTIVACQVQSSLSRLEDNLWSRTALRGDLQHQ